MNHDFRNRFGSGPLVGRHEVDHFFPVRSNGRRVHLLRYLALWYLIGSAFGQEYTTQDARVSAMGVQFARGASVSSADGTSFLIWAATDGINFYQTSVPASGSTSVIGNQRGNGSWIGLALNQDVGGTSEFNSYTISYRMSPGGPVVGSILVDILATQFTVKYTPGNSGLETFTLPSVAASVMPVTGEVVVVDTLPNGRKEVEICIFNDGTTDILTNWGDKFLQLKPGLNHFRYDGPIDYRGNPTVKPADFQGTAITSGGASYVVGVLKPNGTGGASWAPAPVLPPTLPTGSIKQATIRTDTGLGTTINLLGATGVTTVGIFGAPPVQSPSTTTGTGAVISPSSLPRPQQTAANTTSNVTNNYTDKSNVVNSTTTGAVVSAEGGTGYDGPSKADYDANAAAANALQADSTITNDPSGRPVGDLSGGLTSVRGSISTKFSSLGSLLAVQSIPTVSTYQINIPIPGHSPVLFDIDFTMTPFPAIRLLLLAFMTYYMGLDFVRRLIV